MHRVAIIGSTGYGGIELVRLLANHPHMRIAHVVSTSQAGESLVDAYPHVQDVLPDHVHTLAELDLERLRAEADIVFIAAPAGVSGRIVPELAREQTLRIIDLAGDFRLGNADVYETWYRHPAAPQVWFDQAVYGLSEVYAERIRHATLIANPGCYPTAAALGLIPALEAGALDVSSIVIDAKSGVSGAGRGVHLTVHYAEINENVKAYKVHTHQHIPEIEMVLSQRAGTAVPVTFVTHLIPMSRGMMCTMHASVAADAWLDEALWYDTYTRYYAGRPFVRIRPQKRWPAAKEVLGSNYCDIGFAIDKRNRRVTVISVIDNLVKGAAGQAIQNANIMYGWDERTGLDGVPLYP
jgi:N-acetyl-gamma-glutamyl-phosphate reductase